MDMPYAVMTLILAGAAAFYVVGALRRAAARRARDVDRRGDGGAILSGPNRTGDGDEGHDGRAGGGGDGDGDGGGDGGGD